MTLNKLNLYSTHYTFMVYEYRSSIEEDTSYLFRSRLTPLMRCTCLTKAKSISLLYIAYKIVRKCFYLTTHLTHFIYGYMASDIWLRTILIVRKETHCRHISYSLRLTARVLLYAPSHRQDITYHGLCYTSRGALAYKIVFENSNIDYPYFNLIANT